MEENTLSQFETSSLEKSEKKNYFWIGIFIAAVLGIISGWGAFSFWERKGEVERKETGETTIAEVSGEKVKVGQTYGRKDDVFKDTAVGIIAINDDGGEGTHKLIREGGESQTAYLTSSVLDLDAFVGHKVQVWGQTFSSERVGWLMDVGRVKVLE